PRRGSTPARGARAGRSCGSSRRASASADHPEKRHEREREAGDDEDRRAPAADPPGEARPEDGREDDPREEGEDLLEAPQPDAVVDRGGIDHSGRDPEREEREAIEERLEA